MKKERITQYWKFKGFKSAKAFALELGLSDSHISEIDQRTDNRELLLKLRSKSEFNDLNHDWLKDGIGEMLIDGYSKYKQTAGQAETLSKEKELKYGVARVIQDLTPAEAEMIRIARESPEAMAVVRMMGGVDSDTKKDIQRGAEKEKLMYDLMKERQQKNSA
jgi:hypothetical protein